MSLFFLVTHDSTSMNNAYSSPISMDLGGAEYPGIFLDELGCEAERNGDRRAASVG